MSRPFVLRPRVHLVLLRARPLLPSFVDPSRVPVYHQTKMQRRNVVVESARQIRIRLLRAERAEVMASLYQEMEDNRSTHNDLIADLHEAQRRVDENQQKASQIAARIDEEERYYHHGELTLVSWLKECNMEPAAPTKPSFTHRRSALGLGPAIKWEPTMPSVSCFVARHPPGTPPHLVTECDEFRKLSEADRAFLIRRRNLCWSCWLPRVYVDGKMLSGDTCEHPRYCQLCHSSRHHTALCGAPLVMKAAQDEAQRTGLMMLHH